MLGAPTLVVGKEDVQGRAQDVFDEEGSFILNKQTQDMIPIQDDEEGYGLEMWVKDDVEANEERGF